MQEAGAGEILANLSIGYIVLGALILTSFRLLLAPYRAPIARSLSELTESLLMAGVLVFLVIRPFFLQAFFIPTESMERTLQGHDKGLSRTGVVYEDTVHDHLFVNKMIYRLRGPERGEIIVFKAPKEADVEGNHQNENILIKRLIGIPGDRILIKEGKLYRNGVEVVEPYIAQPMTTFDPSAAHYGVGEELTLGPGQYFVMGDNRNHSWDSRFWGVVTRDRIIGEAAFLFWPLNRIRIIH